VTFHRKCGDRPKPDADPRRATEAALERAVWRLYRLGVEEAAMARLRAELADVLEVGLVFVSWAPQLVWGRADLEPWRPWEP
jgi:hypothetical protein